MIWLMSLLGVQNIWWVSIPISACWGYHVGFELVLPRLDEFDRWMMDRLYPHQRAERVWDTSQWTQEDWWKHLMEG
jgi:hypothetical protein